MSDLTDIAIICIFIYLPLNLGDIERYCTSLLIYHYVKCSGLNCKFNLEIKNFPLHSIVHPKLYHIGNKTTKTVKFYENELFIGVFPKWSRTFAEFSEFRESDKSLKHELGSI